MSLELEFDLKAAISSEREKLAGRIDRLSRFRFIQRRLSGVFVPTAAGTMVQDLGSPNPGLLWCLSTIWNGPYSTSPWTGIPAANWNGGAVFIGNASDNLVNNADIVVTFGTSTGATNSINPDFISLPADTVWCYDTESVYVSQSFVNTTSSVLTNLIVREYRLDDVLPSFI